MRGNRDRRDFYIGQRAGMNNHRLNAPSVFRRVIQSTREYMKDRDTHQLEIGTPRPEYLCMGENQTACLLAYRIRSMPRSLIKVIQKIRRRLNIGLVPEAEDCRSQVEALRH